jgi:multiple sugar transport system substrate-binding protein
LAWIDAGHVTHSDAMTMSGMIKKYWGVELLIVVALMYIVPYYFFIQKENHAVTEIYFADRITEAHRILINKYNALHAGKVRVIPTDFANEDFNTNERKEILARSLRGEGDGIDVFAVDVIWVPRFAKWSEPLGKYFTPKETSKITDLGLQTCYSDSQLVAIPFVRDQGALYYREDLLRRMQGGDAFIRHLESGMTWPEFVSFQARSSHRSPFYIFPAADYEGFVCSFFDNLLSLSPNYFKTHGFDFDTPEAARALQMLVDLVGKRNTTPSIVSTLTEVSSFKYFIENDGLFIRGWTTYEKDFEETPVDTLKQRRLRKAPLPYMPGGQPASVLGGWDLMVSKFSTKKEAAVDFVKFLIQEESQEIFYSQSGYYPVVNAFYKDPKYVKKYPEILFIKKLMESGVYRPSDKDYTKYSKIMSHYFQLAMKNRITVANALDQITKAIDSDKILIDIY